MRLAVMGGVLFGVIAFIIYLTTRLTSPSMDLLYRELDTHDSSRIVTLLEGQNIPYELRQNGTEIHVPANRVARLRLTLADQGLPSGGSVGYEIFDDLNALGTTTFIQNVNLIRALEGELARTIQSIESVRKARVHLVLPKRELFSRQRQEPSASVVLKMGSAGRLNAEQISAIQHLVAAAVPSLLPRRISIIDNKGSLLARGFEDGADVGAMVAKLEERRRKFQNRLARTIEELLEKTVGFGKVRAEVSADMDFDRISTTKEEFDPDGQVVRSTQTTEETATTRDAEGAPPVTVGTNLPDPNLGAGETTSSTSSESRTDETVNFEISKRVINHVRESGVVKRLSVAVLLDKVRTPKPDGVPDIRDRSDEDMELLATLVRGVVGFDADRGDQVEVIQMEFVEFEEVEEPLDLFFGLEKNDLLRMAEIGVLSIVALLFILLVARPLISRAFEALPAAAGAVGERLLADQTTAAPALTGPGGVPIPVEGALEAEQFEELIDIDLVEGRVRASSVNKVGEIVEKHPEEALAIVRSWMYQES